MQNFTPQPIAIREVNGMVVTQSGEQAMIDDRHAQMVPVTTILGNQKHYLRTTLKSAMPRMGSGEIAAIVIGDINGKPGYILITTEQYAVGAPERARYSAWLAEVSDERKARQAKERQFDLVNNEGGEGYNPHRSGSERTYARNRRSPDPRYPAEG